MIYRGQVALLLLTLPDIQCEAVDIWGMRQLGFGSAGGKGGCVPLRSEDERHTGGLGPQRHTGGWLPLCACNFISCVIVRIKCAFS